MEVNIVGAGPGDPDLITCKGKKLLEEADLVIYAGSLINDELLENLEAQKIDSQNRDLKEITQKMINATKNGKKVVRLHSGDPSLYGAIVEQIEILQKNDIEVEITPGVSSIFAATSALKTQLTLKGVSESVIFTRPAGDTLKEDKLKELSKQQTTLVIFLGISKIDEVVKKIERPLDTPVAVVYKASWNEEEVIKGKLSNIAEKVKEAGIERSALIIVGNVVEKKGYRRSKLYQEK
ncbi:MAG: Precorrin-4 methylase CobM [Candidatus Methanohalarchaeum thermophilum]|uniref:Precorrin-4 methylase CobM n=1 Tax=Methanohalarchaeum thermophilum TaxID=1903181 RepID=A0A1Q6DVJ7_METT1|nr:MAG: Precorrin-4 methylase CobM [Candidatus Methanohalarchaeum thermophilum]